MEEDGKKSSEARICVVCGDVALGYNFNALSCESCKAFFRRNATKDKELRCPFKENCAITPVTRRFCQRCRLAQCLRVGMKRELIMTEEDKARKRRKAEANKGGRYSRPKQKEESVQTERPFVEWKLDKAVQTDDTIQCEGRPSLGSRHRSMLLDLVMASKALEAPLDQEVITNLSGDEFKCCGSESLLDVINLTAVAIRRLIKMCKRLAEFRSLSQSDQLSLLKHGCTQMMLLRSVVTFDPDRNSWKIPHTVDTMARIKVEVLKEARGNLYEAHEAFLRSFDSRASDDNVINILTAVTLFDPTRPSLAHIESIRNQQENYYELLERYLESRYEMRESRRLYRHLIHKMAELHRLNEDHVRVYLDVNPSQVEPLLIEIFDLKPH